MRSESQRIIVKNIVMPEEPIFRYTMETQTVHLNVVDAMTPIIGSTATAVH